MLSSGICMAVRDFDCILCQRHYARMSADAILPVGLICDECLDEFCQLEGNNLRKHVSERLAGRSPQNKELENGIVSAIEWHKQGRLKNTAI